MFILILIFEGSTPKFNPCHINMYHFFNIFFSLELLCSSHIDISWYSKFFFFHRSQSFSLLNDFINILLPICIYTNNIFIFNYSFSNLWEQMINEESFVILFKIEQIITFCIHIILLFNVHILWLHISIIFLFEPLLSKILINKLQYLSKGNFILTVFVLFLFTKLFDLNWLFEMKILSKPFCCVCIFLFWDLFSGTCDFDACVSEVVAHVFVYWVCAFLKEVLQKLLIDTILLLCWSIWFRCTSFWLNIIVVLEHWIIECLHLTFSGMLLFNICWDLEGSINKIFPVSWEQFGICFIESLFDAHGSSLIKDADWWLSCLLCFSIGNLVCIINQPLDLFLQLLL